MSEKEANELRSVAHEVIIKLFNAKQTTHLDLLMAHCQSVVEEIARHATVRGEEGKDGR